MSRRSPSHRTRFHSFARAVSWHRRKLAVVAAVLTVLTGVTAALPPDPPTTEVVRTTARLDGGSVLTRSDLQLARLPVEAVPDGALTNLDAVVGKTVTAPLPRGEVITGLSVVTAGRSVPPGRVVAPVRLADADVASLLSVGESLDVVAADTESPAARVVARAVRVVALPRPPDSSGVGGSAGSSTGALVLVEVDAKTATALAQAAVTSTLSVVLR